MLFSNGLSSSFSGIIIFISTADIAASTTGEAPIAISRPDGIKLKPRAFAALTTVVKPNPIATDTPTIDVFLSDNGWLVIILIPFMVIAANIDRVAPPITGAGIDVNRADNFGNRPAIKIIMAACLKTFLLTTLLIETIPAFCENVAVGSVPIKVPTIFATP